MSSLFRKRRVSAVYSLLILMFYIIISSLNISSVPIIKMNDISGELAISTLEKIPVKGRAPKTDYSREQFGNDWATIDGCDIRNIILNRDMSDVVVGENCVVMSGKLVDPYTGIIIDFKRGSDTSSLVQIDHVVALSDAWQKGAQNLTLERRIALANDPLELLAVDGSANQQKSDGDAATWLPSNKSFRCKYVARQIAVKYKYDLWVTGAERQMMIDILSKCPNEILPKP